jgi:hypothetical protein
MIQSVILDIQNKLNNKEISCVDLVKQKIDALKSSGDFANNLILEEEALIKASLCDEKIAKGEKLGVLEGVPFGVKDVFLLKNTISTASSNILKNYLSNISNFNYQISFPDCLIYCGYKVCFDINNLNKNDKPNIIIYNNEIYINSPTLNKCKDIEEVLIANLLILDNKYEKNYLSNDELYYLSNWEAEIYRKNLK